MGAGLVTGVCRDCGCPVHAVAMERVMDADVTRIIGGRQGALGRREPHDLLTRAECAAGHVWWLAHDWGAQPA